MCPRSYFAYATLIFTLFFFSTSRSSRGSAPHTGNWLFSLPVSACGLKMDDEAIRVAVALRLDIDPGSMHTCHCGAIVDSSGSIVWYLSLIHI